MNKLDDIIRLGIQHGITPSKNEDLAKFHSRYIDLVSNRKKIITRMEKYILSKYKKTYNVDLSWVNISISKRSFNAVPSFALYFVSTRKDCFFINRSIS